MISLTIFCSGAFLLSLLLPRIYAIAVMKKKFSLNSLVKITPLCTLIVLLVLMGFSAAKVYSNTSACFSSQILDQYNEELKLESCILKKTQDSGNIPADELTHPIEFGSEEEDDDREDDYHSFDAYSGEQAHSIAHYHYLQSFVTDNSHPLLFQIPLYVLFHSWRVFLA